MQILADRAAAITVQPYKGPKYSDILQAFQAALLRVDDGSRTPTSRGTSSCPTSKRSADGPTRLLGVRLHHLTGAAAPQTASPTPAGLPAASAPTGRTPRPAWRQRLSRWDVRLSPYLYISPFFLLFLVVGMFPLAYTAWVSVHDWSLIGGKGEFVGLDNYREVLEQPLLHQAAGQHDQHLPALLGAADRHRARSSPALLDNQLRGRDVLADERPAAVRRVARSPSRSSSAACSATATASSTRLLGLRRHRPASRWHTDRLASHVAIATMVNWRWTGYNALILLAAMQAVPRDLYESAAIDGAGRVRQFVSHHRADDPARR